MKFLWRCNLFYPQKTTKGIEAILKAASSRMHSQPPTSSPAEEPGWGRWMLFKDRFFIS